MVWKLNNTIALVLSIALSYAVQAQSDLLLNEEVWQENLDEYQYEVEEAQPTTPNQSNNYNWNTSTADWDLRGLIIPLGIILIAIVIFLILNAVIGKNATTTTAKGRINLDSIQKIPEEAELNEILVEREKELDFREAIRVRYLKILGLLSDKNLIVWQPDKTNSQYSRELLNHPDHRAFGQATLIFERVWYGELPLNEQSYERLRPSFDQLLTKWKKDV